MESFFIISRISLESFQSARARSQRRRNKCNNQTYARFFHEFFSESGRPLQQRRSRTFARREWLSDDREGRDCTRAARARVRANLSAARSRYLWRERDQHAEEDAARGQRDRSQVGGSLINVSSRALSVERWHTMDRTASVFHKRVMVARLFSWLSANAQSAVSFRCQRRASIILSFRAYKCMYVQGGKKSLS